MHAGEDFWFAPFSELLTDGYGLFQTGSRSQPVGMAAVRGRVRSQVVAPHTNLQHTAKTRICHLPSRRHGIATDGRGRSSVLPLPLSSFLACRVHFRFAEYAFNLYRGAVAQQSSRETATRHAILRAKEAQLKALKEQAEARKKQVKKVNGQYADQVRFSPLFLGASAFSGCGSFGCRG